MMQRPRSRAAPVEERYQDDEHTTPPASAPRTIDDHELNVFVDRFRALINQITQETDDAVEIARRDPHQHHASHGSGSSYAFSSDEEEEEGREDEFGRQREYVYDEHVRVLGNYIRRMPTIESMGSRENRSLRSAASRSVLNNSRPPTRAMSPEWSESEGGRSRSGSLGARSVLGEMGEIKMGSGSTAGSNVTRSNTYHTASSGSARASPRAMSPSLTLTSTQDEYPSQPGSPRGHGLGHN